MHRISSYIHLIVSLIWDDTQGPGMALFLLSQADHACRGDAEMSESGGDGSVVVLVHRSQCRSCLLTEEMLIIEGSGIAIVEVFQEHVNNAVSASGCIYVVVRSQQGGVRQVGVRA